MKIFEILQHIKDTPSSNDKKQILELHADNELLKKVLLVSLFFLLSSCGGDKEKVSIVKDIPYPYIMLTPQVTYYRCMNNRIINKFLYVFKASLSLLKEI